MYSYKPFVLMCFAILMTVSMGKESLGQQGSSYKKTIPKQESLKAGVTVYEYKISYYEPPVKVNFVKDRSSASYDTPEEAFISFHSAVNAVDFDWWFDSFDQNRQNELLEKKRKDYEEYKSYKLKRDSDDLKKKPIELKAYIQYKDYVLLESLVTPSDKAPYKRIIPFKFENGRWKVSLDKEPVSIMFFK